jgi:predicted DNA-binding transcriptional regulator YafY
MDVRWRFHPRAADEAREYLFHPNQQLEHADDGSLLVSFRAGGKLEMAWHLFTWGPDVEVLEPASLWEELARLLGAALARHRRGVRPARPGRGPEIKGAVRRG